jgi:simple sugar transport system ATP-binding protein
VDLYKSFGQVDALRGATVEVKRKSVTALFGDKGAGKSTLLRALCGIHAPDRGDVLIDGVPVLLNSIRDAQARGIDVIH